MARWQSEIRLPLTSDSSHTTAGAEDEAAAQAFDVETLRGHLYFPIADECPMLAALTVAQPLYQTSNYEIEQMRFAQVAQFWAVVDRYSTRTSARLDSGDVGPIVDALPIGREEVSLLGRMWEWFSDWLDAADLETPEWISNMSVSQVALEVLIWLVMVILVGTAGFIIVMEARARAGRRVHKISESATLRQADGGTMSLPTLRDVVAADVSDKPGMLLRVVLEALVRSGRIASDSNLTHQEISALPLGLQQQAAFGNVVRTAEVATYGRWIPAPDEVDDLCLEGERVLHEILGTDREHAASPYRHRDGRG